MRTRVGFIINFGSSKWLGGYNYFKNLFQGISENKYSKIEPVIITDDSTELKSDSFFKKYEIITTDIVSRSKILNKIFSKFLIIFLGRNFFFDNYLKKNKIKILSHSGWIGYRSKIFNYPWIPDIQEIHLPENFSLFDKIIRRFRVFFCTYYSTNILISSNSVRQDLRSISKKAYSKSLLIKHAVKIPEIKNLKSLSYLKKKYKIRKKFFFLPNHYWVHKNHIVVLKALSNIKNKKKYQIVSTGNFSDYRHPGHVENLKNFIIKNKIENDYLILKIVPYIDMMSLMYHSISLINPSKSEGWSNTVEQAKSMNKITIVSNIKVHKEQKNKKTKLFNPDNYFQLRKILDTEYLRNIKKKNVKEKNSDEFYKKKREDFIKNYENKILKKIILSFKST